MERIQSLINKLSVQSRANASLAELLETTELLRNELLTETRQSDLNVVNAVAVWLPSGYTKKPVETITRQEPVKEEVVMVKEEVLVKEINPVREISPVQAPKVPVPPSQVVASAEPVSNPFSELNQNTASQSGYYQLDLEEDELEPILPSRLNRSYPLSGSASPGSNPYQPKFEEKNKPVQEVISEGKEPEVNTALAGSAPKKQRPFPEYPEDASELMKNIFPLANPPASAKAGKEINELVADPAVPLYEKLQQRKVELGDVLAEEPKITDLRKAFTINDRYQVIHSLFRNDEDMFERSIKTINNFGSLPEAHFWMQRELALKLGWNDKDEMVRSFYKLVTRRFA